MSNRTRAILINAALLTACIIQLARGLRPVVVIVSGITFLIVANALVLINVRFERRRAGKVSRFAMHEPGYVKPGMRERLSPRERDEHRMDGPR